MRWICKFLGGVICIKNVKYGVTYVPEEDTRTKETKKPTGENALDAIKEDIARIQDELIKQNRDNLDAMYNLDMDNFSSSFKKTFGNALAQIELTADDTKAQFEALAQWKTDTTNSIASIRGTADANSASISSIASWQSGVNSSISSIEQTANSAYAKATTAVSYADDAKSSVASISATASANSASIENIVSLTNEEGEKFLASLTLGVKENYNNPNSPYYSFINMVADKVEITADEIDLSGYVTLTSLKGTTGVTVNGSLIKLFMDGMEDDGESAIEGSSIQFIYGKSTSNYVNLTGSKYAAIMTKCADSDTDVTSRYAMNIETYEFRNYQGTYVYPAIKLNAAGRVSISGDSIYMETEEYITQSGTVLIRPSVTLGDLSYITPGKNDFVFLIGGIACYVLGSEYLLEFADNGLYFNGNRLAFASEV